VVALVVVELLVVVERVAIELLLELLAETRHPKLPFHCSLAQTTQSQ
jgi:hypothetical protein